MTISIAERSSTFQFHKPVGNSESRYEAMRQSEEGDLQEERERCGMTLNAVMYHCIVPDTEVNANLWLERSASDRSRMTTIA